MSFHLGSKYHCCFDDFVVDDFLQQGGWGKVFAATRKIDGKKVAMKFFGYTQHSPIISEINNEIRLMMSLDQVEGVCQLIGIFEDTPAGYVPEKNRKFCNSYPVIVMEMLQGGDLFARIANRPQGVTESYLAITFLSIARALQSLHERGFIHRDLKLDNVMLTSVEEPSTVKLIDFGMMVSLQYPHETMMGKSITGTEAYFAPESLTRQQYGYKSDVWQLGCILYAMLAGHPPFHSDPKFRANIVRGKFYPIKGPNWERISESAKDLVTKMLDKNPETRLGISDIMSHPWLHDALHHFEVPGDDSDNNSDEASQNSVCFGNDYNQRIKNLVLRSRLRRCFAETCIASNQQVMRECFQVQLPFLDTPSAVMSSHSMSLQEYFSLSAEYNAKLLKLKELLVLSVFDCGEREEEEEEEEGGGRKRKGKCGSEQDDGGGAVARQSKRRRRIGLVNIEFPQFSLLMESVQLDMLATSEIFNIFDEDSSGSINAKEFLKGLMALRTSNTDIEQETEAAHLYFDLFDVDEDGKISKAEMAMVIDCLLHDGAGPVWEDDSASDVHLDEVFETIDVNKDGFVDFEEFKKFYYTLLQSSSVRSDRASSDDRLNVGGAEDDV